MGAKDWMLLYAEGAIRPILQAAPPIDRAAARALVGRLYPAHRIARVGDGTLSDQANPADHLVYAGCFPGLTVVCTADAALDRPSQLPRRFLDEAAGRTVYPHAMHSVVDWFAYAIWAGQRPVETTNFDERPHPLPFHPLELGEETLRALFGFNYEGVHHDDDPDLENIVLCGFTPHPVA